MPLISLAKADFGSLGENVPRVKLSNMYIVQNPLSLSGASYISRPSLTLFTTLPESTIRGIFYKDSGGVTVIYVVAGNNLYTLGTDGSYTLIGAVPGVTFCTFASTIYHIAINSDGILYLYDGTTLTQVTTPGDLLVSDVTSLDNYFIFGSLNTSTFYWITPGSTTVDSLHFESAERNPDDIVTMISVGDELWAIGQETVEIFTDTGDQTAPFIRTPGRVFQVGCVDKHSIVKCNLNSLPCLIWVTPQFEVILSQGHPSKISNESIEELLRLSKTFTAWTFRVNRHDFYVLTTDTQTIVYDLNTSSWFRWSSYNKDTWDAFSGVQINGISYVINQTGGNIYNLSTANVDKTSDYIVCEVGGFIPNNINGGISCNSITLYMNYGTSLSYTKGPLIELRWSDDGGNTWTPYYQRNVGTRGYYDNSIRFRSLGNFPRPGRHIELRFSELSNIRIDGATMNDTVE